MAWRLRADAPETTEWQDIFDKKLYGETALDVYEEVKGLEAQAEELARKTRKRRAVVEAYERRAKSRGRNSEESHGESSRDGLGSSIGSDIGSDLTGEDSLSADDLEFFAQYKERRKKELAAKSALSHYGELREVRAQEYTEETHSAGSVVALMYAHGSRMCMRVRAILQSLAARFPYCKFVAIEANECVNGYPESLCPTVLVYKDGKNVSQFVGTSALGGTSVEEKWLERELSKAGAFHVECDEDSGGESVEAARHIRSML